PSMPRAWTRQGLTGSVCKEHGNHDFTDLPYSFVFFTLVPLARQVFPGDTPDQPDAAASPSGWTVRAEPPPTMRHLLMEVPQQGPGLLPPGSMESARRSSKKESPGQPGRPGATGRQARPGDHPGWPLTARRTACSTCSSGTAPSIASVSLMTVLGTP